MAIFNSYVKLPEGMLPALFWSDHFVSSLWCVTAEPLAAQHPQRSGTMATSPWRSGAFFSTDATPLTSSTRASASWAQGLGSHYRWLCPIQFHDVVISHTGWWFQPSWKIWKSMGRIIPYIMENKNVWNHQPAIYIYMMYIVEMYHGSFS